MIERLISAEVLLFMVGTSWLLMGVVSKDKHLKILSTGIFTALTLASVMIMRMG